MDRDEVDLYEDLRIINFWFWTENGFKVQTAEYQIQSLTTMTVNDIKRSLPMEIYKPPAGFEGDPYHEYWRRNCVVYDGMLLEDNATLTGIVSFMVS